MMKTKLVKYYLERPVYLFLGLIMLGSCNRKTEAQPPVKSQLPQSQFIEKTIVAFDGTSKQKFYNNYQLYSEGWDTLAQCKFWQDIISLSHDSVILNVACERRPLHMTSAADWHCQTEAEKDCYKKNICLSNNLNACTNIYVTAGKKFFFEYRKVLPMISQSLPVFEANETDPWFAQAILLIESPGKTEAKSYVGARGPFQLMPYVARKYGLVVTKYRDDRTSLQKSATAAAKLISNVCIPYARKILDAKGITYNETDLWFRLFVLHIYHAGAGNVASVIDKINPGSGGMDLIRTMWQTESRGFKNESQNYSQIALASMVHFDRLIREENDTVYLVQGDKMYRNFQQHKIETKDTLAYLNACLAAYESDLVDGTIPFEYFVKQTGKVHTSLSTTRVPENSTLTAYSESDRLHQLGSELMYKRKYDEAIKVFQLGIERNPVSPAAYDSLGKAYRLLGKNDLALKYTRKSKEISANPESLIR